MNKKDVKTWVKKMVATMNKKDVKTWVKKMVATMNYATRLWDKINGVSDIINTCGDNRRFTELHMYGNCLPAICDALEIPRESIVESTNPHYREFSVTYSGIKFFECHALAENVEEYREKEVVWKDEATVQ